MYLRNDNIDDLIVQDTMSNICKSGIHHVQHPLKLHCMKHRPLIYVGGIGQVKDYVPNIKPNQLKSRTELMLECDNDLEIYKFGVTSNIVRRSMEHKRVFNRFDIQVLRESYKNYEIESLIRQELRKKKLLLQLVIKQKVHNEIMYLPSDNDKEWFKDFLNELVIERYKQLDFINFLNASF